MAMATTFKKVCAELRRMDPSLQPDSTSFQTAAIMLSALVVGANARRVAAFTGYGAPFVRMVASRLRDSGIWRNGKTRSDWAHPEHGGIAFWCDVAVAEGFMERVAGSDEGSGT